MLISRKRYKIETYFQWNTNRKSCMAYRMAPVLVTLNDLEGHSPVAGLFKCNPSNICAVFYHISTDSASRRPSATAGLLVNILHFPVLQISSSFSRPVFSPRAILTPQCMHIQVFRPRTTRPRYTLTASRSCPLLIRFNYNARRYR